jgi:hypothetical protein
MAQESSSATSDAGLKRIDLRIIVTVVRPLVPRGATAADRMAGLGGKVETRRVARVDTVSDNGSSASVRPGRYRRQPARPRSGADGLVFERGGEIVDTATQAAVVGNPARSVAWLANTVAGTRSSCPEAAWCCRARPAAPSVPIQATTSRFASPAQAPPA